jgi:DNA invertase Pin-like site-specific DNA recombinase
MTRRSKLNGARNGPAMPQRIVAYARVSTQDQDLSGQLAALKAAGAEMIFREKVSGVRADRPQLKKMVTALRHGDLVIVTRLDRLGRSVRELLNLLADLDHAGVGFRSLGDPWCDTTTPHGRLMLTVLGGLAEFERALILERTSEGRKRAMANGVRFGRKPKLTPHQRAEALQRRGIGEPLAEIARTFNVSVSMISRL